MAASSCAKDAYSGCPPLVEYPQELMDQAARELETLPSPSAVGVLVTDYGKTRDACRAIGVQG